MKRLLEIKAVFLFFKNSPSFGISETYFNRIVSSMKTKVVTGGGTSKGFYYKYTVRVNIVTVSCTFLKGNLGFCRAPTNVCGGLFFCHWLKSSLSRASQNTKLTPEFVPPNSLFKFYTESLS